MDEELEKLLIDIEKGDFKNIKSKLKPEPKKKN